MADLGDSLASLLQVPGLQQLLNQQMTQQNQQQPLRTAINQQAANMLPNSAFAGQTDQYGRANMAAVPQANFSTPPPSSGMSPVVAALLGAGGGAGLALLLKKLLSGGSGSGGGNGSLGASGPSGGGSTFSFGHDSLGGYVKNLFSREQAPGGLKIPGGEFDPKTVYGGQPQPPAQENWNQIPDWLTVQQNNGVPMDPSAGGDGGGYDPNADNGGDGF